MQLDSVSVYSVTDAHTADEITEIALALPGISRSSRIVDGCACVGGNLISFARAARMGLGGRGGIVVGIEMDPGRFEMLRNNARVSGVATKTRCYNADFADSIFSPEDDPATTDLARGLLTDCDLLFLDPPWGGPDVNHRPMNTVELSLSGRSMGEICRRMAKKSRAKHVLLKLPPNYALAKLKSELEDIAEVSIVQSLRKIVLVVVSFAR
jgi:predicted RNA methylase